MWDLAAPWVLPHNYINKEVRTTDQLQHNTVQRQCSVHDGQKPGKLQKDWVIRTGIWNVDSLTGRAGEVVKVLGDRKVDVTCVQKTRWMGSGWRFLGLRAKGISHFWCGCQEKTERVLGRSICSLEMGRSGYNSLEI